MVKNRLLRKLYCCGQKLRYFATCLLLILPSFFINSAYAAVTASVDKPTLDMGDTVQLSIYADNLSNNAVPDLSDVVNDFDLLSSSQTQQVAMVNNRMTSETVWIFMLSPKHAGKQEIPAINVGSESTLPISLNVTENSAASSVPNTAPPPNNPPTTKTTQSTDNKVPNIFIKADLSPNTLYVQGQGIYTLHLFYDKQIINPQMALPIADGGNFIRIGDNRVYDKVINNRSYEVLEMKYAFFPEKSGPITIKGPIFDGDMVMNDNNGFLIGGTKAVHVAANTIVVNVQPIPAAASNSWWLPAEDAQISEKWSANLTHLQVGVPITRTVTLAVKGVAATQLPALISTDVPDMQIYPDKPKLTSSSDGETVFGTRIEKAAYIPTQAGNLILPAIKINWWNTQERKLETVTLPAINVTVLNGANTPVISNNSLSSGSPGVKVNSQYSFASNPLVGQIKTTNKGLWLVIGLTILWIVTAGGWLFYYIKNKRNSKKEKDIAEDAAKAESWRQAKMRVERAVKAHDPVEFSASLLNLAAHRWPDHPILSLNDLAQQCQSPAAKEALISLDALRYSYSSTGWQADITWKILEKEFTKKNHSATDEKENDLPALW